MGILAQKRGRVTQRKIKITHGKYASDVTVTAEREERMTHLGKSIGVFVEAPIKDVFIHWFEAKFSDHILTNLAQTINQQRCVVDMGMSDTEQVLERVPNVDLSTDIDGKYRRHFWQLQGRARHLCPGLLKFVARPKSLSRQAEQTTAHLEETSAAFEGLTAASLWTAEIFTTLARARSLH